MKILDSSGVINLRGRELEGEFLTVREVEKELRDIQSRLKFAAAVEARQIKFAEPSKASEKKVHAEAERAGCLALLSDSDLKVLSLAYETGLSLVTDDYDIQNMCSILGIKFERVSMKGIQKALKWKSRCTACGKVCPSAVSECSTCGSQKFSIEKKI